MSGYFGPTVMGPQTAYSSEPPSVQVPGQLGAALSVDGTPVRVVAIAVSAAIGLYALRHIAGIRFNVGVSG